MKQKLFTLLLAFVVSVGTLFAESGTCGENLTWDLTNGVLTISGTGAMTNWSSDNAIPWYTYRKDIIYVTIGNSVTSIGKNAFNYCTGLTSITIPNSVTSIGDYAFFFCTGLTSITIPNSVTSIGSSAFSGCSSLPVIDNIRYADTYLVKAVDRKLSYTIREGTKWIGDDAFSHCTGLTSIEIPNSVTSIGSQAFNECTGLTSITIPNSVTSIGNAAFSWCSSLTSIVVASGNTKYDSRENCNAIIETSSNTLIHGCKNTIIPNSVTSIGYAAFSGCTGLTSITIPNSVTSIGYEAFSWCSSLTSITIPNSVTSIGRYAFEDCTGLTSFYNYASTPQVIVGRDVFYDVNISACTLYVPEESVDAYKAADVWKNFGNITAVQAAEGIEEINSSTNLGGSHKLLRNGQVLILRGDKTYTVTGQEVK